VSSPSRPTCSVIVLTYQSAATIDPCLDALLPELAAVDGELIVVDNGSTDGSVERLRDRGIEPIDSGGNVGFARGCNLGASHATGRLLVFVNPDAQVAPGCLSRLASAAEDRPGPLGARAEHADGSYDRRSVLGRPSLAGALTFASGLDRAFRGSRWLDPEHGPRDLPVDPPLRSVPAVSGALLAVPRDLWDELGGFDERYFLYGEDVDLCLRAAKLGRRPTLVVTARYQHVGGVSSGGSSTRGVLLYRGKATLYRTHLSVPAASIAVVALQVGAWIRGVAVHLPVRRLAGQARPWWQLWKARRSWRAGYTAAATEVPS
jgi:N-acetylglucosaminyl-diphospho-decaprenol L-rhamnosyltransferase